jgi:hypothetical protein
MDPAYFVGRKEILNWINDTLALNLTKIEDTATGMLCVRCRAIHLIVSISRSTIVVDQVLSRVKSLT